MRTSLGKEKVMGAMHPNLAMVCLQIHTNQLYSKFNAASVEKKLFKDVTD